jgi:hypothetical protein
MKGDVAFSYAVLKQNGGFNMTMPAGYVFALAGEMTPTWRVVGEFGGSYKTTNVSLVGSFRHQILGYLGGLRFAPAVKMTVRPYVQFLVGGERATLHQIGTNGSAVANGFALQPGFGFDFKLTRMLDGRAQLDYRAFRTGGVTINDYRFAFGVVYPFGR